METLTKEEAMELLGSCKRTSLRCRDTGATEIGWELPEDNSSFNDKYVASGWFDAETSSITSESGADRLDVSFSFDGRDADELRNSAASRTFDTLQPSEVEQERASLERLAKVAREEGWAFHPATCSGLMIG